MRHSNSNRKLGRVRKQRKALLNSLARSIVLHRKIKGTDAKIREVRPFVEKLITVGKADTVANRRILGTKVGKEAAKIVVETLSKKYADRKGGYTRITKMPTRKSDGSKMAMIELI